MTHPLDQSLALAPAGPNLWRAPSSPLYWNAIGPYGGWIATMLLHGVQSEPAAQGDPISLQAQFIGALRQAPFTVATSCLRQNRSTAFWRSEIRQGGGNESTNGDSDDNGDSASDTTALVCAHATITLGNWRETATISDAVMPMTPPALDLPVAPARRARTPPFIARYDFRPVKGVLGTLSDSMDALMWVRDAEPRTLDARSLTALCDAALPSIWLRMPEHLLTTTVVYNIFFRTSAAQIAAAGNRHILLESHCAAATAGFFDQRTNVWSDKGELLAQTEQLAWYSNKGLRAAEG